MPTTYEGLGLGEMCATDKHDWWFGRLGALKWDDARTLDQEERVDYLMCRHCGEEVEVLCGAVSTS